MKVQSVDGVTVAADGSVTLPRSVLERLGWEEGDVLRVEALEGGELMLTKPRRNAAQEYAGAFTDLYPDPEDTRRFLDEGRGYEGDDQAAVTRTA